MTVNELIKELINTDNYLELRMRTHDDFIEFVKSTMPSDYEYFREREESFQGLIGLIQDGGVASE